MTGSHPRTVPSLPCACCGGESRPVEHLCDDGALARRCESCGSYRLAFPVTKGAGGLPWASPGISPAFRSALAARRAIQARAILELQARHLAPVARWLDYGCGQGVFLRALSQAGVPAVGTDLEPPEDPSLLSRFAKLSEPWGWPALPGPAQALSLLDVLEHIPDAKGFLAAARARGVRHAVIKIPLVEGPLARTARLLALFGKRGIWDALILRGDVAPHLHYFSDRGLRSLAKGAGFRVVACRTLPEVGAEIRARIRIPLPGAGAGLGLLGALVGALGYVWSDTRVYVLEASASRPDDPNDP